MLRGLAKHDFGALPNWKPGDPGDGLLRAGPIYSLITTGTNKDTSSTRYVYGYDRANARVLALTKDSGSVAGQYRLAGDPPGWSDMRGMYVVAGTEAEPDVLVWIDKNRLMSSILEGVQAPTASPGSSGGPSPAVSPTAKPTPTKKPKKTPRP
jgi:hypothetical protein